MIPLFWDRICFADHKRRLGVECRTINRYQNCIYSQALLAKHVQGQTGTSKAGASVEVKRAVVATEAKHQNLITLPNKPSHTKTD